jgi:hypothetical protein
MASLHQIRRYGVPHDSQSQKCNSHKNFSFSPENVHDEREKSVLGLDMTSAIVVKRVG